MTVISSLIDVKSYRKCLVRSIESIHTQIRQLNDTQDAMYPNSLPVLDQQMIFINLMSLIWEFL